MEPPGFWKTYARVIELASIALILFGLFTNFVINHDSNAEMRDILILSGIALVYMLAYFHLAIPQFGDVDWLQIANVIVTVIILAGFQHISHLVPQIALLLMLVVCITGLRLGLIASLLTGVFSALMSLGAVAYGGSLSPGAWFFAAFQLIVYLLAAYLSTQVARTLSSQTEETVQRNRNIG